MKSRCQQRISQVMKSKYRKGDQNDRQASMEFASPRQSKLHLLSVAQSNQHLVDPMHHDGLELGVEHRSTEEEYIASSFALSKIQSEIQLQQVNQMQNVSNFDDSHHQMSKSMISVDNGKDIIRSTMNEEKAQYLREINQRCLMQNERLITCSMIKPFNQNQETLNFQNFLNEKTSSIKKTDNVICNTSLFNQSLIPGTEGNINQCHGDSAFIDEQLFENNFVQYVKLNEDALQ